MSSVKNNNIYKKTSFLEGSNSSFIEEFYSDYLSNPSSLPEGWKEFFDGLKDNKSEKYLYLTTKELIQDPISGKMVPFDEWDNDGAHGTIRSVMYTDDEISGINHMIAIQAFPWPHAVGLTEAFTKGIDIGACEGEWSTHHSSGIEPWGGIPGDEIRGYCAEKATGIDVSEYYP